MRRLVYGLAALLTSAGARAEDAEVRVDCPVIASERQGQVEARLRATLLTQSELPTRVLLTCPDLVATAEVERAGRRAERRLRADLASLPDTLLAAADLALFDLSAPEPVTPAPAEPAAAPRPAPLEPKASTPAIDDERRTPLTAPAKPTAETTEGLVVRADGLFERWPGQWAAGGALALDEIGYRWFGVVASVLVPTGETPGFRATEVAAAAEAGTRLRGLAGCRVSARLGVSALFIEPRGQTATSSGQTPLAFVMGADLSRPIELGPVALIPSLGVRAFFGGRRVILDRREVLDLSGLVPHAALGIALHTGE